MAEGKFTFAVLMLAERAKCERFKVTLAINNLLDQTVFSAQFNPTPISMKNVEEARASVPYAAITYKSMYINVKGKG